MSEMVTQLLGIVGADGTTRLAILIVLALVGAAWWAYSAARKEHLETLKQLRPILEQLYGPAYHLLLAKRGRRVTEDEFRIRFADTLIKYGHLAAVDSRGQRELTQAAVDWLQAVEPVDVEARLEVYLGDARTRVAADIELASDAWNQVWVAILWMVRTCLVLLTVGFVIVLGAGTLGLVASWRPSALIFLGGEAAMLVLVVWGTLWGAKKIGAKRREYVHRRVRLLLESHAAASASTNGH